MEKDGAGKMDRKNMNCSCARKRGRMKNNAGSDKEEENKLAGPLNKKELSSQGCSARNVKREEGSRQKKISDDSIMINELYADTKMRADKRVEWRILCLQ